MQQKKFLEGFPFSCILTVYIGIINFQCRQNQESKRLGENKKWI